MHVAGTRQPMHAYGQGQTHRPWRALEQAPARLFFQSLQLEADRGLGRPDGSIPISAWRRLDDALERIRAGYAKDVAILPPDRVAALVADAGFVAPLRFHQAGMIHGWCARRS